jgi:ribose 5-phosphate isomerase B
MTLYLGADHRGFALKQKLKIYLKKQGHKIVDLGADSYNKDDDFTDFTFAVAEKISEEPKSRGIVICGSAGGVTIAANKVAGVRCVTAVSTDDIVHNRAHDDVNVLALSSDFTSESQSKSLIEAFLKTKYLGEPRHKRRLKKISDYEEACCGECGEWC